MTTTKMHDINATLQQIAQLTTSGCDIVRVACPRQEDADALRGDRPQGNIPVIADIRPTEVHLRRDRCGCAAVREPRATSRSDGRVKARSRRPPESCRHPDPHRRQRRFAGQADDGEVRQGDAGALVESALWEASLFEEHGLRRHQDLRQAQRPRHHGRGLPPARRAVRLPAAPLGVTEAGPAFQGTISRPSPSGSAIRRIGDTIRVSCRRRRSREIKVGDAILQSLNLRPRRLEIVSCPSCGRAQVDVYLAGRGSDRRLDGMEGFRCASPSWVVSVNGPGRPGRQTWVSPPANGKGQIFVRARSSRQCRVARSSRR